MPVNPDPNSSGRSGQPAQTDRLSPDPRQVGVWTKQTGSTATYQSYEFLSCALTFS